MRKELIYIFMIGVRDIMIKEWEELTEQEQLLQYISDMHKSAYGSRPRGGYDHMSVEELKVELDKLSNIANDVYEQEKAYEEECADEFDSLVLSIQASGAGNRETALKWLLESSDCGGDLEYFIWGHGFLFTDRGQALKQELAEL